MTYAETTTVPAEKSRSAIEKLLRKHGATGIGSVWDEELFKQFIDFKMPIGDRRLVCRLICPMPFAGDPHISHTATGKSRTASQIAASIKQVNRSRWRILLLMLRAKMEWIEIGGSTFEEEFLPNFVMPSGNTLGEEVINQLPAVINAASPLTLSTGS